MQDDDDYEGAHVSNVGSVSQLEKSLDEPNPDRIPLFDVTPVGAKTIRKQQCKRRRK